MLDSESASPSSESMPPPPPPPPSGSEHTILGLTEAGQKDHQRDVPPPHPSLLHTQIANVLRGNAIGKASTSTTTMSTSDGTPYSSMSSIPSTTTASRSAAATPDCSSSTCMSMSPMITTSARKTLEGDVNTSQATDEAQAKTEQIELTNKTKTGKNHKWLQREEARFFDTPQTSTEATTAAASTCSTTTTADSCGSQDDDIDVNDEGVVEGEEPKSQSLFKILTNVQTVANSSPSIAATSASIGDNDNNELFKEGSLDNLREANVRVNSSSSLLGDSFVDTTTTTSTTGVARSTMEAVKPDIIDSMKKERTSLTCQSLRLSQIVPPTRQPHGGHHYHRPSSTESNLSYSGSTEASSSTRASQSLRLSQVVNMSSKPQPQQQRVSSTPSSIESNLSYSGSTNLEASSSTNGSSSTATMKNTTNNKALSSSSSDDEVDSSRKSIRFDNNVVEQQLVDGHTTASSSSNNRSSLFLSPLRTSVQVSTRRLLNLSSTEFPLLEPTIEGEDCDDDNNDVATSSVKQRQYELNDESMALPLPELQQAQSDSMVMSSTSSMRKSVHISPTKLLDLSPTSFPLVEPGSQGDDNSHMQVSNSGSGNSGPAATQLARTQSTPVPSTAANPSSSFNSSSSLRKSVRVSKTLLGMLSTSSLPPMEPDDDMQNDVETPCVSRRSLSAPESFSTDQDGKKESSEDRRGVRFLQKEEPFAESSPKSKDDASIYNDNPTPSPSGSSRKSIRVSNLMDKVSMSSLPSVEPDTDDDHNHASDSSSPNRNISIPQNEIAITSSVSADSDTSSSSSPRKSIHVERLFEKVSTSELPLFEPYDDFDNEQGKESDVHNKTGSGQDAVAPRSSSLAQIDEKSSEEEEEEGNVNQAAADLAALSTPASSRKTIRVATLLKDVSTTKLQTFEPDDEFEFMRAESLSRSVSLPQGSVVSNDSAEDLPSRNSFHGTAEGVAKLEPKKSNSCSLATSSKSIQVEVATHETPSIEPEESHGRSIDGGIEQTESNEDRPYDHEDSKRVSWSSASGAVRKESVVSVGSDFVSPRERRRTRSLNDTKGGRISEGKASMPGAVNVPGPLAQFEQAISPLTRERRRTSSLNMSKGSRTSDGKASMPGAVNVPGPLAQLEQAALASGKGRSMPPLPFSPGRRNRTSVAGKEVSRNHGHASVPGAFQVQNDAESESEGSSSSSFSKSSNSPRARRRAVDGGLSSPSPRASTRLFGGGKRGISGVALPTLPSPRSVKGGSHREDRGSGRASMPGAFHVEGESEEFQQDSSSVSFSSAASRSNRGGGLGSRKGSSSVSNGRSRRAGKDVDGDGGSSLPGVPAQLAQFEQDVALAAGGGSSSFMSPRRAARQMKLAEMGQRPSRTSSRDSGSDRPTLPGHEDSMPRAPALEIDVNADIALGRSQEVVDDAVGVEDVTEANVSSRDGISLDCGLTDEEAHRHSEFHAAVQALQPGDIESGSSAVRVTPPHRSAANPHAINAQASVEPKTKTSFFRIVLGIVIMLATAVAVITVRASSSRSPEKLPAPVQEETESDVTHALTERRRLSLELIRGFVSSETDLKDPLSPQSAALDWIVFNDTMSPISDNSGEAEVEALTTRYVLAVIYHALDGQGWYQAGSWLDGEQEICTWGGVNCTDTSFEDVQGINLKGNNLKGSVPSEIQHLSNLKSLSLTSNQITGISESLGPSIEWLDLGDNQLTGELPPLFEMKTLEYVNLGSNMLSGTLSWMVGNLPNLRELYLYNNYDLSGRLPLEFFPVESLKTLDISSTLFEASFDDMIQRLPHLDFISVHRARNIGGTIPPEISELSSLEHVFIGGSQINGTIPTEVGQMSNLVSLYAGQTYIEGPIPSEIGMLSQLTELGLEATQVNATLPSELGNLKHLEYINLQNTRISGTLPVQFGQLSNLESIFISGTMMTGTVDYTICEIPSLDRICVSMENQNAHDVSVGSSSSALTCFCGEDICRC